MSDSNSCALCSSSEGELNSNGAHPLCEARERLGVRLDEAERKPTPRPRRRSSGRGGARKAPYGSRDWLLKTR